MSIHKFRLHTPMSCVMAVYSRRLNAGVPVHLAINRHIGRLHGHVPKPKVDQPAFLGRVDVIESTAVAVVIEET